MMESPLYKGSHQELFEAFLRLVDDSAAQTAALLDLMPWEDVGSLLSIGGGQGLVEASLLHQAPKAKICYLDPSSEMCEQFRQYLAKEQLLERIEQVAEVTYQEYATLQKFDRILSVFSWYFIGANEASFTKLFGLLAPKGTACIILPNTESIFAAFTRSMSPDKRMALVGDDVMEVLDSLDCVVSQHTYTKWLAGHDLFDGERASKAALAFAAFVAMRPIATFTPVEKQYIVEMLRARQEANGVPIRWDAILVKVD